MCPHMMPPIYPLFRCSPRPFIHIYHRISPRIRDVVPAYLPAYLVAPPLLFSLRCSGQHMSTCSMLSALFRCSRHVCTRLSPRSCLCFCTRLHTRVYTYVYLRLCSRCAVVPHVHIPTLLSAHMVDIVSAYISAHLPVVPLFFSCIYPLLSPRTHTSTFAPTSSMLCSYIQALTHLLFHCSPRICPRLLPRSYTCPLSVLLVAMPVFPLTPMPVIPLFPARVCSWVSLYTFSPIHI